MYCISIFRNEKTFNAEWLWGNSTFPYLDYYNCLGIKLTYNGHWNAHINVLVTAGEHMVNSLFFLKFVH